MSGLALVEVDDSRTKNSFTSDMLNGSKTGMNTGVTNSMYSVESGYVASSLRKSLQPQRDRCIRISAPRLVSFSIHLKHMLK